MKVLVCGLVPLLVAVNAKYYPEQFVAERLSRCKKGTQLDMDIFGSYACRPCAAGSYGKGDPIAWRNFAGGAQSYGNQGGLMRALRTRGYSGDGQLGDWDSRASSTRTIKAGTKATLTFECVSGNSAAIGFGKPGSSHIACGVKCHTTNAAHGVSAVYVFENEQDDSGRVLQPMMPTDGKALQPMVIRSDGYEAEFFLEDGTYKGKCQMPGEDVAVQAIAFDALGMPVLKNVALTVGDIGCAQCPGGKYTSSLGAAACRAQPTCSAGRFAAAASTDFEETVGLGSMRLCDACAQGRYESGTNARANAGTPITWTDLKNGAQPDGAVGGLIVASDYNIMANQDTFQSAVSQRAVVAGQDAEITLKCDPRAECTIGFTAHKVDAEAKGKAEEQCAIGWFKARSPHMGGGLQVSAKKAGVNSNRDMDDNMSLLKPGGYFDMRAPTGFNAFELTRTTELAVRRKGSEAEFFVDGASVGMCNVDMTGPLKVLATYAPVDPSERGDGILEARLYDSGRPRGCNGCPSGKYQSFGGAITCTPQVICVPGYRQTSAVNYDSAVVKNAARSCSKCPVGRFEDRVNVYSANCKACPAGKYQPMEGGGTCLALKTCPPGTFVEQEGTLSTDRTCKDCPAFTFSTVENKATACKAFATCAAGKYASFVGSSTVDRECAACPAGRFEELRTGPCDGVPGGRCRTCTDCVAGQFQDGRGAIKCTKCGTGKYQQATGTRSCKNCGVGRFGKDGVSSASDAHCEACAEGQFQDAEGQTACKVWSKKCTGNEETQASRYEDRVCEFAACPYGTWFAGKPTQAGDCAACAVGGAECAVGYYQDGSTSACVCKQCPAGHFADTTKTAGLCQKCAAGRHQQAEGKTTCDFCSAGRSSATEGAASASACAACVFGSFAAMGSKLCSTCPENKPGCPTGKFRSTLNIACECTECKAGQHSASITATVCDNCAKGQYASGGTENCSDCAVGKKASAAGKSMCDSCQRGTYAAARKSEVCTPCESGKFQSVSGRTECTACPGGKYTSAEGRSFCQTCASGNVALSCSGAKVAPTHQTLTLDLANDLVEPSSLLTRAAALTQLDTVQNQLTTCASTFTAEEAFATATKAELAAAEAAKVTSDLAKTACESKATTPTNAPTAAATTGAAASCAGSVAIDTNGNGKVDVADATELFVATTMQGYGAASMINIFRANHLTGAMTPVKAIIANVKAAMAQATANK